MSEDNTNNIEDINPRPEGITEHEAADRESQLLMLYGDCLTKLAKFGRFSTFLELNYEIRLKTDDETKQVYYEVVEKSPSEVTRLMTLEIEKVKAQQTPSILSASPSELKKFS